jgi:hypothetical protein
MWGLGQRSNIAFIIADIIYCCTVNQCQTFHTNICQNPWGNLRKKRQTYTYAFQAKNAFKPMQCFKCDELQQWLKEFCFVFVRGQPKGRIIQHVPLRHYLSLYSYSWTKPEIQTSASIACNFNCMKSAVFWCGVVRFYLPQSRFILQ